MNAPSPHILRILAARLYPGSPGRFMEVLIAYQLACGTGPRQLTPFSTGALFSYEYKGQVECPPTSYEYRRQVVAALQIIGLLRIGSSEKRIRLA